MRFFKIGIIAFMGLLVSNGDVEASKRLVDYVNPNIGTAHCRWFFYTPAALPFGMAKLAPSTDGHLGSKQGWQASGYDFRHTSIEGFANFHEFQIGGVVFAPSVGALKTVPGELENPKIGYRSRFCKKDEVAKPGYYSVLLKDYGVKVELTATKRVGFHRYTFPKSDDSNIIFDIGNMQGESGDVIDAYVQYFEDGRVEGYVITSPIYVNNYQKGADIRMYFSAVLSKKPIKIGSFVKDNIYPDKNIQKGVGSGLYLTFSTREDEAIEIKVGLSYTSIDNARYNMKAEATNLDFDGAKKEANRVWTESLSRITVEGGKDVDKEKFYTALYHAILGRGLANDANGYYPKNDGTVGRIAVYKNGMPKHNHYNTDAIWGGFWNLTQLWALVYPEYYSDWVKSQLLVYKDAGWLGDGMACSKYVSGVGTNFTGLSIATAYNCGIRDFDIQLGYAAALKNEIEWKGRIEGAGKMDVRQFIERGYVPYDKRFDSVTKEEGSGFGGSHTLEYSFSAYSIAQFAKCLGKSDDYKQLTKLSEGWRFLYDKEYNLIRPKDTNGEFIKDFKPLEAWRGFQEGNAVQYTFYVPHHIEQLIDIVGKETFNNRLDSIFIMSQKNVFGGGTAVDAFAGLNAVYNHGNQPNLHISWLFNFSGKPYLSQKWVHAILNEFYGNDGIHGYGYGQDEDQGQLSAWYVMSALGLFDVKGLTDINPKFQIGTPLFDKVSISLNQDYYKGKKFIIETSKKSIDDSYLQSIFLNGKEQRNVQILFNDVVRGGKLTLKASEIPNMHITN